MKFDILESESSSVDNLDIGHCPTNGQLHRNTNIDMQTATQTPMSTL